MDLQSDSFDKRRQVFKNVWNKNVDRTLNEVQFNKTKVIKTMKQSSGSVGNKNAKMMKYEEKYKKLSNACNKLLHSVRKSGNNPFVETILGPESSPKRKKRKRKAKKQDVYEKLYRNGNVNSGTKREQRCYDNVYKFTVEDFEKESLTDLRGLENYLNLQLRNSKPHPSSALSRGSFFKRKVIPSSCVTEYTGFRSPKKQPADGNRKMNNNPITLAMTRSIRTLRHPTNRGLKCTYYTIKFPEI